MTSSSAASSVAERLELLLLAEGAPVRVERDLRDGVWYLQSQLDLMASDADREEGLLNADGASKKRQINQLAYDIEDAVEYYVLREEEAAASEGTTVVVCAFRRLVKYCCLTERSLRKDLRYFRKRIDELGDRVPISSTSGGPVSIVEPQQRRRPQPPPPPTVMTSSVSFKSLLDEGAPVSVGEYTEKSLRKNRRYFRERIDELGERVPSSSTSGGPVSVVEPQERLKQLLLEGTPELSVIAICGMGGSGKTTLAQLVYNDNSVKTHFEHRVWAVVSQDFQARDILENFLLRLGTSWGKDPNEIAGIETMELIQRIHKAQRGRRYLVVLDDIWSEEAWKTLKIAFRDDNNGSRIVITTRIKDLVPLYGSTHVLEMRPLPELQSWEILKKITGLEDKDMQANPEIRNIAIQILSYCEGFPLALTVVGGMLSRKNLNDWNGTLHALQQRQTSESTDLQTSGYPNLLQYSLEVSYNDLPSYLRPCFLYLGHFPADKAISAEKLYLLWMAEGLISLRERSDSTRMEAAEYYFEELVSRYLVIAVEKEEVPASTRFKSFKIHEEIRNLCISKAKLEEFSEIIGSGYPNKISPSTRRLVMYLNECNKDTSVLSNFTEANHIRSILFLDIDESMLKLPWPTEFSDLNNFQKMRVLHFEGIDFRVKKLPRGIEKLIYLRYLSFRDCYLQEFSSSFCNFSLLETLDLRVRDSCTITIPNVLNKLSSLRHLYFPLAFRSNTEAKLKLHRLKKLEILENFHAEKCDALDLLQLENLQILTVTVNGDNVDLKNTVNCINKNKFLRHSSLVVKNFDTYSKEGISVVATLLESNAVHSLYIEGHLGLFPCRERIGSNFTKIVFDGSEFSEDVLPILGKLPNLINLVLCNDAFVGKEMVCSGSDFPQLKSLELSTLPNLENWRFDGDLLIMPKLTALTIEKCQKLDKLPYELAKNKTLKDIMIGSMPEEFCTNVMEFVKS